MKKLQIKSSVTGIIVMLSLIIAQPPQLSGNIIEKGISGYEYGFGSEINRIVESAMENAIILHHYYPDYDYDKIIAKLDKMIINGGNVSIQRKALIAALYFRHPDWFTISAEMVTSHENNDSNVFFSMLYESLNVDWYASSRFDQ